jgi:hypothetical protein
MTHFSTALRHGMLVAMSRIALAFHAVEGCSRIGLLFVGISNRRATVAKVDGS